MLIWGTKAVKRSIDTGEFHCPQCRSKQAYKLMSVRKHGHVYWIPLFGMGEATEYVECSRCGGQFVPEVLDRVVPSEEDFHKAFLAATVATMVAVAGADGRVDDTEIEAIQGLVERFVGSPVDRAVVQDWAREPAEVALAKAESLLTSLGSGISDEGREMLVRVALHIAVADGDLADAEFAAIQRIATALRLSPAHFSGLLGSLKA